MVSIVIPCYNSQSTIARVLSSVIDQTYTDYEIILVDDGSTDDTKGVIEAFFHGKTIDHKYIYQENSGPSAARNRGVENSSGEYIAFLDSDDVWHPQKLEIMISIMNERKIDVLGHDFSFVDNAENSYVKNDGNYPVREFRFYHLLLKNFAVTPSVVISRKVYEKFNEKMRYVEDHE
jgi:glycosyltransferase involved in cell wall biosynthesis